ncbi:MAG: hypothetical protein PVJ49_21245 [Acidobacteriota bacterium]|jgi:hypothetical protein
MRRVPLTALIGPLTVLAALVLVANVILFALWTAPRWSARLGVAGGGGGVAAARERIEPSLRVARTTYGRVDRAGKDLDAFRERLIVSVSAAELLGMLDSAGDGVGIDLDDATLQYVPLEELGVLQLGITFPVSGSYEAVRELLDELVELPVFLVIDGVGLQTFGAQSVGGQAVRVDLAISVFLDDRETGSAPTPTPTQPARPVVGPRQIAALQSAVDGGDPSDIADAVIDVLAALPQLPVDPQALVVDLERLDTPVTTSPPSRNLFSIVLPRAPEPEISEQPQINVAPPEPVLPVRLLGVLRIEGRWHASLSDEQHVFVVKAGDNLPNGVQIVSVGKDFVEVTYRDRTTRLNLEGTRP